MDPKEIKSALKAAKEAIKNKEYKEALKNCKAILKTEKNHYNALVFVGVAAEGMEQPDQALMAYKKAIEADETQPLAWQGLCNFYEKTKPVGYHAELVGVYKKLCQFSAGDKSKTFDLKVKMCTALEKTGNHLEGVEVYQSLLNECEEKSKVSEIWYNIVQLLEQQKELSPENTMQLTEAYEHLVLENGDTTTKDTWHGYIEHLVKTNTGKVGVNNVAYLEKYTAELENVNEKADILDLLKCFSALQEGNTNKAHQLVKQSVAKLPKCVISYIIQSNVLCKLHDRDGTASSVDKGIKVNELSSSRLSLRPEEAARKLKYFKLKSLTESKDHTMLSSARQLAQQLVEEDVENVGVLVLQCQIMLSMNETENAKQVYEKAFSLDPTSSDVTLLQGRIALANKEYVVAQHWIQKSLETYSSNYMAHFWLGKVHWEKSNSETDEKEKSFTCFLKAAKLDPYFSESFVHLGLYYDLVLNDKSKAIKCYKKAFDLDRLNEQTGAIYVDALMADDQEEAASELLTQVTENSIAGRAKWAWIRLGLCQLKQEDPSVAILSFQSALRADPLDRNCWECLGEAYMTRGSYTAALRAFTRATELDPKSIYSFYQIAAIKQTLGLYTEALEDYKKIFDQKENYVPALKGIGETYIHMVRSSLKNCFQGRAVDQCSQAIQYLTRAASIRADLSCLWKLLGDACTILHELEVSRVQLEVPSKLTREENFAENDLVIVDKQTLLAIGSRCYGMALKLLPDCASLWHDLGVNYQHQAALLGGTGGYILAAKSVQVLQKAVTLDPNDFKHWNALGFVASSKEVSKPELAQHCFIKSIEAEANNVVAWTNLGTLYYVNEQVELAHEAFKVAQSLEPSYVASWIGQALVAETVGHEEAMDLFRHTSELANHIEGSLGYAQWVCSTILDQRKMGSSLFQYNIEQMAAIPAASDALARYTDTVKNNPTAYNMYGMLLERQGLHRTASEAYARVVDLLSSEDADDKQTQAKLNYARALCNSGQYELAVEQYQTISGLSTFDDVCGLGLALFKAERYAESYKAYAEAVDLTDNDRDKSHTSAAKGIAAYKAGNTEQAKSALFASFQSTCPSENGLLALCSLGLIESDETLTVAVLKELHNLVNNSNNQLAVQTSYLQAQLMAIQGNVKEGKRSLAKDIHKNPTQADIWQNIAKYTEKFLSSQSSVANRCCRIAAKLGYKTSNDEDQIATLSSLGSGLRDKKNPRNIALSSAQKMVHNNPADTLGWCSLLAASHAGQMYDSALEQQDYKHDFNMSLTAHLLAKVESELSQQKSERYQSLHLWCVKQYIICLLMSGRAEQAKQFLNQAVWLYDSDVFLKAVSAMMDKNNHELKKLTQEYSDNLLNWQILSLSHLSKGLVDEAEMTYKMCLTALKKTGSQKSDKITVLLHQVHLAYNQIMNGADKARWNILLHEAEDEMNKLTHHFPPMLLMLAILALVDKKTERLGKRHLQQILSDPDNEFGLVKVLARKHLLKYLLRKGDKETVQQMVNEAEEKGNCDLILFLEKIQKADAVKDQK